MSIFGVETLNRGVVQEFMEASNSRLKIKNLAENPFNGNILRLKQYEVDKPDYYLVNMKPIYPSFYFAGIFFIIPSLFFNGLVYNGLILTGLIFLSTGLLWTKYFFYFMLKLGLRKAGYKGHIKLISNKRMLGELAKCLI